MSEHFVSNQGELSDDEPLPRQVVDFQRLAGLVGVIAFGLLALSTLWEAQHAFRSLLFAFVYWVSISLGCLGFVMISHLTGGGWGRVIRRFAEAAFMNLPLMLGVFLILCLGFGYLFPWAHFEQYKDSDPEVYKVLFKRHSLYNGPIFTLRVVVYFAIWLALAVSLRSGSLRLDRGDNPILRRKLRKISAAGMVLFFVTTLAFAMDFFMSREAYWYSSILGFITAIGMGISGMAFASLNVCYFADRKPLKDVLTPQHLNDLGNILLALVILWMYTSFAQFLIQWCGTMREDVSYYTHRGLGSHSNGWMWVAVLLLFGHFFIPFFLLLMKGLKRKRETFARIAILLLCMRVVENLWLVAPSGAHRDGWDRTGMIYWTDVAAWVGVGGLWMFFYLRTLGTQTMLARNTSPKPRILTHVEHGTQAHAI